MALFDFAAVTEGLAPLDENAPRPRTVIVTVRSGALAIPVDAVREVREVPNDALQPPTVTSQRFSSTEIEIDGQVMPVFDLVAFIDSIEGADGASLSSESAAALH